MFEASILGYTVTAVWYMFLAVFSIIVTLWPAMIAKSKGSSFLLWFLLSIPFWWITFFVTLFMKDKSAPASPITNTTRQV